jgi:rhodanese-related sulfurtransferase/quercetin dioxygenase-like cupin family protein
MFKRQALTLSLFSCLAAAAIAAEPSHKAMEGAPLFSLEETKWVDGPPSLPKGAQIAVLEGDPNKEGPFVFRVKAPDGYRIPPHTHPKMERVTVISGTFHIGMGETFDADAARPMPAGTYGYWPPGMKHFVWVKGETIVQFHGDGPWKIVYVNPADDPRRIAARTPVEFTEDTLEVVKRNVQEGTAVLVDVRGQEEWNAGHLEDAVFLPVTSLRKHSLDPEQVAEALPEKKVIYTFCVVGMRAKIAAKVLEQLGYEVRALKPGYDELRSAGFR